MTRKMLSPCILTIFSLTSPRSSRRRIENLARESALRQPSPLFDE